MGAAWTSRPDGGYAAYGAALDVVDAFVAFWERHRPVLRVVELAAAEGDDRFARRGSGRWRAWPRSWRP